MNEQLTLWDVIEEPPAPDPDPDPDPDPPEGL